jgi:hypothetical protein
MTEDKVQVSAPIYDPCNTSDKVGGMRGHHAEATLIPISFRRAAS